MGDYVSVYTGNQEMLPSPCPQCIWWQRIGGVSDREARLEWMARLEQDWGPPGLVLIRDDETRAAVQFAPVWSLPRVAVLPPGSPPDEAVLVFCLRARLNDPISEPIQLLQRTMFELRRRGASQMYAYARPLGNESVCGLRNLFGYEFLSRHGFTAVKSDGEFFLMKAELFGLLPALKELRALLPRWGESPATPSPALWSRPRRISPGRGW